MVLVLRKNQAIITGNTRMCLYGAKSNFGDICPKTEWLNLPDTFITMNNQDKTE